MRTEIHLTKVGERGEILIIADDGTTVRIVPELITHGVINLDIDAANGIELTAKKFSLGNMTELIDHEDGADFVLSVEVR